ncbi:MAG: GGDEF domain-containing protein [Anaerolineaceae bacterium]
MESTLITLSNGLVIAGLLILVGALFPLRKLIDQLAPGPIRKKWYFQSILIFGFIIGYLVYAIYFWRSATLIVPFVFFFGAAYVWLTINLSLQTSMDIRRSMQLEQENITDPLIGIYNRRYMDKRLEEEFKRAKRYNQPLSLLLIDIDFFKKVNDTYGHPFGDLVLRHWGGLILSVVRASDIVSRYGGDEILVITPSTPPTAAFALAERIRQHIEMHKFILSNDPNLKYVQFTVSIGVASLTPEIDQVEKLMKEADQALYRAKDKGRNCVIAAEEVMETTVEGL